MWLVCRLITRSAVIIGIEFGPVHGYHDLGAFTDHIGTQSSKRLQTLSLVLVSRRSTCFTACLRSRPLAKERPFPMAWMASEPDSITRGLHWPGNEHAWHACPVQISR